jgi:polar amino acid transport system substrate-binding protein
MHKKSVILVGISIFLVLSISFSGCLEDEEKLDPTIKRIQNSGKLIVGTSTPYEPMEYIENGEYVGFDVELAEKIAEHFGVTVEIVDYTDYEDFEDILDYVTNGDVDIMLAAITINLERSQRVDFSVGYLNAGQVIIVNESNEDIITPDDLEGLSVGVQSGTTGEEEAFKYTENVIGYGENFTSNATLSLISGKIDAIIVDYPVGATLIKNNSKLKIIGDPFTSEYYGIAIKKGEASLQNELNTVISNLENSGEMQELRDKWLPKT